MPSGWFPNRVLVHAVRVHIDDNHGRTLVYHHVRYTPQQATQTRRLRQHNGSRLAVLGGHGCSAADGHQRLLKNQVSLFLFNFFREESPYFYIIFR